LVYLKTKLLMVHNQENARRSPDPFLLFGVGSGDETKSWMASVNSFTTTTAIVARLSAQILARKLYQIGYPKGHNLK
jgi:hypothetical protein